MFWTPGTCPLDSSAKNQEWNKARPPAASGEVAEGKNASYDKDLLLTTTKEREEIEMLLANLLLNEMVILYHDTLQKTIKRVRRANFDVSTKAYLKAEPHLSLLLGAAGDPLGRMLFELSKT
jgi:hypothetical protein